MGIQTNKAGTSRPSRQGKHQCREAHGITPKNTKKTGTYEQPHNSLKKTKQTEIPKEADTASTEHTTAVRKRRKAEKQPQTSSTNMRHRREKPTGRATSQIQTTRRGANANRSYKANASYKEKTEKPKSNTTKKCQT